jgi:hypothetical protein
VNSLNLEQILMEASWIPVFFSITADLESSHRAVDSDHRPYNSPQPTALALQLIPANHLPDARKLLPQSRFMKKVPAYIAKLFQSTLEDEHTILDHAIRAVREECSDLSPTGAVLRISLKQQDVLGGRPRALVEIGREIVHPTLFTLACGLP